MRINVVTDLVTTEHAKTVKEFLLKHGLEQYYQTLVVDNGYERLNVLINTPLEELTHAGMKPGHARQLLQALKDSTTAAQSSPAGLAASLTCLVAHSHIAQISLNSMIFWEYWHLLIQNNH